MRRHTWWEVDSHIHIGVRQCVVAMYGREAPPCVASRRPSVYPATPAPTTDVDSHILCWVIFLSPLRPMPAGTCYNLSCLDERCSNTCAGYMVSHARVQSALKYDQFKRKYNQKYRSAPRTNTRAKDRRGRSWLERRLRLGERGRLMTGMQQCRRCVSWWVEYCHGWCSGRGL